MTRESARWMDISSFWTLGAAEAAGESYRPPMAYPEPGGMLAFAPFHWFIWGMSVYTGRDPAAAQLAIATRLGTNLP